MSADKLPTVGFDVNPEALVVLLAVLLALLIEVELLPVELAPVEPKEEVDEDEDDWFWFPFAEEPCCCMAS